MALSNQKYRTLLSTVGAWRRARDLLAHWSGLNTSWWIITGAPGSGKSSLARKLRRNGYAVERDVARELIVSQLRAGIPPDRIRADLPRFRANVFLRMLEVAVAAPREQLMFFDYGLPDNLAFYRFSGLTVPIEVLQAISSVRYAGVFLLSPLAVKADRVRIETRQDQQILHHLIKDAYIEQGYEPKLIEAAPLQNRFAKVAGCLPAPNPPL